MWWNITIVAEHYHHYHHHGFITWRNNSCSARLRLVADTIAGKALKHPVVPRTSDNHHHHAFIYNWIRIRSLSSLLVYLAKKVTIWELLFGPGIAGKLMKSLKSEVVLKNHWKTRSCKIVYDCGINSKRQLPGLDLQQHYKEYQLCLRRSNHTDVEGLYTRGRLKFIIFLDILVSLQI